MTAICKAHAPPCMAQKWHADAGRRYTSCCLEHLSIHAQPSAKQNWHAALMLLSWRVCLVCLEWCKLLALKSFPVLLMNRVLCCSSKGQAVKSLGLLSRVCSNGSSIWVASHKSENLNAEGGSNADSQEAGGDVLGLGYMSGEDSDGGAGPSRRPASAAPGPPAEPISLKDEARQPSAAASESAPELPEEEPGKSKTEHAAGKSFQVPYDPDVQYHDVTLLTDRPPLSPCHTS